MKQVLQLSMICLGLSGGVCTVPVVGAEKRVDVLARDMKQIGPGVQWTRRDGYCTLQILLNVPEWWAENRPAANAGATQSSPQPSARLPATQVWLLRADGTTIPVLRTARQLPANRRETTATITYAYPLSASKEAAAVTVMIDGRYIVERLEPFPDEKP